jgi:hypothetical protein
VTVLLQARAYSLQIVPLIRPGHLEPGLRNQFPARRIHSARHWRKIGLLHCTTTLVELGAQTATLIQCSLIGLRCDRSHTLIIIVIASRRKREIISTMVLCGSHDLRRIMLIFWNSNRLGAEPHCDGNKGRLSFD